LVREFRITRQSAVQNARAIMMATNVIDCVQGRKKSVGIIGSGHVHGKDLTGIIRRFFSGREKVATVQQIAGFADSGENLNLQKKLMGIEAPVVVPRHGRNPGDYLVLQRPVARPHSPEAVERLERRLGEIRESRL
jgi:hypothetical protein